MRVKIEYIMPDNNDTDYVVVTLTDTDGNYITSKHVCIYNSLEYHLTKGLDVEFWGHGVRTFDTKD